MWWDVNVMSVMVVVFDIVNGSDSNNRGLVMGWEMVVSYALERILLYFTQHKCAVVLDLLAPQQQQHAVYFSQSKSRVKHSLNVHSHDVFLLNLPTYTTHFIIIMSIFHFAILNFTSSYSSPFLSSLFFFVFTFFSFDIIIFTVRVCVYWKCAFIAFIFANVSVCVCVCFLYLELTWVIFEFVFLHRWREERIGDKQKNL